MKKIFISTLFLLFAFASTTFAHSYLKSSTPGDGQSVDGNLNEITLQFDTPIQSNSLVSLTNEEGKEIPVSTSINNDTLIAKFTSPLESGTYTVSYNIIGEDGHPMSGSYIFLVTNAEDSEAATETESSEESGSSFNWVMIIIGAIVIVAILALLTRQPNNRRRRRF